MIPNSNVLSNICAFPYFQIVLHNLGIFFLRLIFIFELFIAESPHPYPYLNSFPRILKVRSWRIWSLDLHPYRTPNPSKLGSFHNMRKFIILVLCILFMRNYILHTQKWLLLPLHIGDLVLALIYLLVICSILSSRELHWKWQFIIFFAAQISYSEHHLVKYLTSPVMVSFSFPSGFPFEMHFKVELSFHVWGI